MQYYARAQVPMRRRERPRPSPPSLPLVLQHANARDIRVSDATAVQRAHARTCCHRRHGRHELQRRFDGNPSPSPTATPPIPPSQPRPPEQTHPTQDPSCVSLPVKPSCPIITLLPRHLCPCLGPCRARGVLLILGDRGSALSLS